MRRALVAVAAAAVIAVVGIIPATASAQCRCDRQFAAAYSQDTVAKLATNMIWEYNGVAVATRRKINDGIYDWAKRGMLDGSFCDRNRKVCKAIRECVAYAAPVYAIAASNGHPGATAARAAASACATAAVRALLAG